jgi:hypothetical protein
MLPSKRRKLGILKRKEWSFKSFFKLFLYIRKLLVHTWGVGFIFGCHMVQSSLTDAQEYIYTSVSCLGLPVTIRCPWQGFLYEVTLAHYITKGFSISVWVWVWEENIF